MEEKNTCSFPARVQRVAQAGVLKNTAGLSSPAYQEARAFGDIA